MSEMDRKCPYLPGPYGGGIPCLRGECMAWRWNQEGSTGYCRRLALVREIRDGDVEVV
jgi:hypothetical protein